MKMENRMKASFIVIVIMVLVLKIFFSKFLINVLKMEEFVEIYKKVISLELNKNMNLMVENNILKLKKLKFFKLLLDNNFISLKKYYN
jgi:hypothetical protein